MLDFVLIAVAQVVKAQAVFFRVHELTPGDGGRGLEDERNKSKPDPESSVQAPGLGLYGL